MTDKERELMTELQDMTHAELVSEYLDLHAAFLAAENRIQELEHELAAEDQYWRGEKNGL